MKIVRSWTPISSIASAISRCMTPCPHPEQYLDCASTRLLGCPYSFSITIPSRARLAGEQSLRVGEHFFLARHHASAAAEEVDPRLAVRREADVLDHLAHAHLDGQEALARGREPGDLGVGEGPERDRPDQAELEALPLRQLDR